ncbi:hypothetical protein [Klebsiella variicola]|uniref:hypothetical protein n=1 Tax=Klebsiella variicola TaxID=244366 RepID=UPI000E2B5F02|nr:hypothetical protein [Klebsiella variicola]SXF02820.1 Uncharacterised protein [Klebsiella variicola]
MNLKDKKYLASEDNPITHYVLFIYAEKMEGVKMLDAGMVEKKSAGSAALWMREAVEAIDKHFGDGYASAHPELVAGFMQAAAIDQAGMYIRSLVETLDLWPGSLT